jgi:hypothetical protein
VFSVEISVLYAFRINRTRRSRMCSRNDPKRRYRIQHRIIPNIEKTGKLSPHSGGTFGKFSIELSSDRLFLKGDSAVSGYPQESGEVCSL